MNRHDAAMAPMKSLDASMKASTKPPAHHERYWIGEKYTQLAMNLWIHVHLMNYECQYIIQFQRNKAEIMDTRGRAKYH